MTPRYRHSPSQCLFCRIASGEVPSDEVYRDDRIVAFLDIGPIREGHVQIIPIKHYETFETLPDELGAEILNLGQRLARVQKRIYAVERVAFMFTGGDVSHAHAHIVPLVEKTDVTSRRYIVESELTWRTLPSPDRDAQRETAAALARGLADDESA
ncbi:HIT family protein [Amorphus sp. 3PC139-8]|uniref:HIT family protein n=1 Tax=Amorphus sp. 3PC139-8 TaxID=2735676 RepID=UPI00345D16AD